MRRALTLIETLIAAMLIALVLVIITVGVGTVRGDLKRRQTAQLLAQLDKALTAYHRATGRWPSDPEGPPSLDAPSENDGSGDRIIAALTTVPPSRKLLDELPAIFRVAAAPDSPAASPTSQPASSTVQDSWGHRLRCITADSPNPVEHDAVAANDGKPVFISAGPDGRFGPQDHPDAADNIRSDGR